VARSVSAWLIESHAAVGNGKQHGRVAAESPEMIPGVLKHARELKEDLEATRVKWRKIQHAKDILLGNGMPDYFDLMAETVINGSAPPGHLFWLTMTDKLKNNCHEPNGFHYNEDTIFGYSCKRRERRSDRTRNRGAHRLDAPP